MRAGRRKPIYRSRVALPANPRIVDGGFRATRNVVGIMTGLACQAAFAPQKTLRLPKPVSSAGDFELIVKSFARRMIEGKNEVSERLARDIGEWRAAEFSDQARKPCAGCQKMALHADIHLTVLAQPGGIDDSGAYNLRVRGSAARGLYVLRARSMAPLALDSFGDGVCVHRIASRVFVPRLW
jgi:hypothetical protein